MNENFEESWERVKEALKLKRQKELAAILRLSQSAITEGKKGGKFPERWAIIIEDRFNISAKWILTGEKPQILEEAKGDMAFYEELEEWAKETGRSENTQWLKNQIESFFPMFSEWKKRKAEGGIAQPESPSSKVA